MPSAVLIASDSSLSSLVPGASETRSAISVMPRCHFRGLVDHSMLAPGKAVPKMHDLGRRAAVVSDAPGTKELKELSLAIKTARQSCWCACSHPGIEAIVAEAARSTRTSISSRADSI